MKSPILALIHKDFLIEWRNRVVISGALLYTFSSIFITYLSFEVSTAPFNGSTWQTLFWVIFVFAATNLVSRSFFKEEDRSKLYYYQLSSPESIILAKTVYNAMVLFGLSTLTWIIYSLVFGSPVVLESLFFLILLIASVSFASSLTLISAISSKGSNQSTLMVVLGFPIVIPQILLLIRSTQYSFLTSGWENVGQSILTLLAIDAILLALSYMLFPYLWRS